MVPPFVLVLCGEASGLSPRIRGPETLFRFRWGTPLIIQAARTLVGSSVIVETNFPENESTPFKREQFRPLPRLVPGQDGVVLRLNRAGAFQFRFKAVGRPDLDGEGYLVVEPKVMLGGQSLPLDALNCLTVMPKLLGPLAGWKDKLLVAKESGYNVVHFTPVETLGGSRSAYCLANQHQLNPEFESDWDSLGSLISFMRDQWGIISLVDIVLNHTANESPWLEEHPEATYNCASSPHLRPAVLLDITLHQLAVDIGEGLWVERGIPAGEVASPQHLATIKDLLVWEYLPKLELWEFYALDVEAMVQAFQDKLSARKECVEKKDDEKLQIIPDSQYRRFKGSVDLELALRLFHNIDDFRNALHGLNDEMRRTIQSHVLHGIDNAIAEMDYKRLASHGPHLKKCDRNNLLVERYFTRVEACPDLKSAEAMVFCSQQGGRFRAHNGWIADHDPLINFATAACYAYLRRDINVWGDSVKLRYGNGPDDSPFLWQFMTDYVTRAAQIFHGIRLDNCHSTPLLIAEHLMDAARAVRPDLYVIAELFTNSMARDNLYINRLGINSIIREANQAGNQEDLGNLCSRYGGDHIGTYAELPPGVRVVCHAAHGIIFDQSHDNESLMQQRSVYDLLPTAAVLAMSCSALGSNKGFDEFVPHHIHVVTEERKYRDYDGLKELGILRARKVLNELHTYLGANGFTEIYVEKMSGGLVSITRYKPDTHESFLLVAHTTFNMGDLNRLPRMQVEGKVKRVVLEAFTKKTEEQEFVRDKDYVNGLENYHTIVRKDLLSPAEADMVEHFGEEENATVITFKRMPNPGSILVLHFRPLKAHATALEHLTPLTQALAPAADLQAAVGEMSFLDMNYALYRCQEEEWADRGEGIYELPGFGRFNYGGLQGLISVLADVRRDKNLGHPIAKNLRDGNWLMDCTVDRLSRRPGCVPLALWFSHQFEQIKTLPRFLVPKYFEVVIQAAYRAVIETAWRQMTPFVRDGSHLGKMLALSASLQHVAHIKNADMPTPNEEYLHQEMPSIAAGLPHFSTGYMRSWGRDTFIALRGALLLPGRYEEAKFIILSYACTLRHGLIPNLLDGGRNARFNCRDATWWWLYCLLSYAEDVPSGESIFKEEVTRLYPTDQEPFQKKNMAIADIIHESLSKHFAGLEFRERNAGRKIDEHMTDPGFNVRIGVDTDTGFVFGGNRCNCGTWMDKMGSSEQAGNKGIPATPRDGSAVEIVGLSYACLRKLADFHSRGAYPHEGVTRSSDGLTWTLSEWANRIQANFESKFFISDPAHYNFNAYRDTVGSSEGWTDDQLRCNFPLAMAVAPELFTREHAWRALQIVKSKLMGPLGIKTLSDNDWQYRGYYDNGNQSNDKTVAHGFNYHQGPEWLWPVGYFLRAYLHFGQLMGGTESSRKYIYEILCRHANHIETSSWRGLPELTNANGAFCAGSNPTQAWSMACSLEVLYELQD